MSGAARAYRAIFDQAAVGIARVAPDGKWLEVNDRLCAIVGYSRQELLGLSFQDITHPDDLETDLARVAELLANQRESYSLEKRYLHRDGHIVPIALHAALVRHPDGTPDFFVAVVQDESARHHAQTKAANLNRHFLAMLDRVSDFVYFKDAEGRYTHVSSSAARWLGLDDWRDLIGRTDSELLDPAVARRREAADARVTAARAPSLGDVEPIKAPGGKTRLTRSNRWPLGLSDSSDLPGVFGVMHDITELLTAQQEMRLAVDVFANTREGILVTDAQANILKVNDAFTEITGYSAAEVIGCNPRMFSSGRHDQAFFASRWSAIHRDGSWAGEI